MNSKKSNKQQKQQPAPSESSNKYKVTKLDSDDLKKVKGGITPGRCCGGRKVSK